MVAAVGGESEVTQVMKTDEPVALLIGNEAHGLPETVVNASGVIPVSLEMPGGVESLNAAVAASILMYLRMTA